MHFCFVLLPQCPQFIASFFFLEFTLYSGSIEREGSNWVFLIFLARVTKPWGISVWSRMERERKIIIEALFISGQVQGEEESPPYIQIKHCSLFSGNQGNERESWTD